MSSPKQNLFNFVRGFSGTLVVSLLVLTFSGSLLAQKAEEKKTSADLLAGSWESDEAKVVIRRDGTLMINGQKFRYKIKNQTITVSDDEGSLDFPFQLKGDRLTVKQPDGREVVYTRVDADAGDEEEENSAAGNSRSPQGGGNRDIGSNPPELVGKWCYMSNLTGTNSRMSSRCFTLYEDGTYEYYAETSSSGSVASSASQESDAGRWSVSGNTITAYSNTNGKMTFSLEKRNHPKTGDPMLVLDGDAFVTAYQKQPW